MLAVRAVQLVSGIGKCGSTVLCTELRGSSKNGIFTIRNYASEVKGAFRRAEKRRTLKEIAMAPATDSAFNLGKGVLAGASAFGLGALCYYGVGLSKEVGAIDKAVLWPQYVKDRIKTTYMYFGGGLVLTAVSTVAISRSPALMNLMMRSSWLALGASLVAVIGSGMLVRSIPYQEGTFGAKQLAWMLHTGVIGAVVAPLCLLGGPILVRAAWYTAGVIGGLSTLAACAPSEKFLSFGAPLAVGLGVVFVSSIGTFFLPATTALGAGLYSISMYGGLVIFSGFLLYDTQRIVKKAETHPVYGAVMPYDPINQSISIYLDTINIFIRIAMLLAGSRPRK